MVGAPLAATPLPVGPGPIGGVVAPVLAGDAAVRVPPPVLVPPTVAATVPTPVLVGVPAAVVLVVGGTPGAGLLRWARGGGAAPGRVRRRVGLRWAATGLRGRLTGARIPPCPRLFRCPVAAFAVALWIVPTAGVLAVLLAVALVGVRAPTLVVTLPAIRSPRTGWALAAVGSLPPARAPGARTCARPALAGGRGWPLVVGRWWWPRAAGGGLSGGSGLGACRAGGQLVRLHLGGGGLVRSGRGTGAGRGWGRRGGFGGGHRDRRGGGAGGDLHGLPAPLRVTGPALKAGLEDLGRHHDAGAHDGQEQDHEEVRGRHRPQPSSHSPSPHLGAIRVGADHPLRVPARRIRPTEPGGSGQARRPRPSSTRGGGAAGAPPVKRGIEPP